MKLMKYMHFQVYIKLSNLTEKIQSLSKEKTEKILKKKDFKL